MSTWITKVLKFFFSMIFPSIHLSILPTRFVNGIICSTSTRACDMPPLPWLQEKWRLRYLIFYANAYNWQQNIRNITKFKKSSVKCFKMMLKTSTSCFEQIDPKWRLVGEEILGSYFCIISWVIYSTNYGITLFILCCLWNTHISPGSITIFLLVQLRYFSWFNYDISPGSSVLLNTSY